MADKKATPILYVCTAEKCTFSTGAVSAHADDKPYGAVSAKPGIVAKCPVCGAACDTVEDGRHKFLRLNSMRVGAVREKMRLIGNTLKGAQYEPTQDDLKRLREVLYGTFDVVNDQIDKREERILNPEARTARKGNKVKRTFSL